MTHSNKNTHLKTSLHSSPFVLLGVTLRDNLGKIVEQAEEKSLYLDSDVCTKARNDLTTLRNRLNAEVRWLPGVSPNRAAKILEILNGDIETIVDITLPPLAGANVMAAALEVLDPELSATNWSDWIIDFAYRVDLIDPLDIMREINTDRLLSGFSNVKEVGQIESELEEQIRFYSETIKTALNKLASMKLVEVVTEVVNRTTESGENHAPQLVHELVDRYEIEASRYLEPEAENIFKLIEAIKANASNGEASIGGQIDKLDQVARKWDSIAQPIQLSMKAQGLNHNLSHDVAWKIRDLGLELYHKHKMVSIVEKLTNTLQELFAELPEVVEKLDQDSDALDEIKSDIQNATNRAAEWAREITYQAELGILFKDTLKISPDGVEWRNRSISLDAINKVRWGAVRKSVNGIPTGTVYTLAVGGDDEPEIVIETGQELVYEKFIDCLWKAVCVRLLEHYLLKLKAGNKFAIGGVSFDDNGIYLSKHNFFSNEAIYKKWGEVTYHSQNGSLFVTAKDDKKTYINMPYLTVQNAHILEAMIRLSFKNWKGRLSGLFDN